MRRALPSANGAFLCARIPSANAGYAELQRPLKRKRVQTLDAARFRAFARISELDFDAGRGKWELQSVRHVLESQQFSRQSLDLIFKVARGTSCRFKLFDIAVVALQNCSKLYVRCWYLKSHKEALGAQVLCTGPRSSKHREVALQRWRTSELTAPSLSSLRAT